MKLTRKQQIGTLALVLGMTAGVTAAREAVSPRAIAGPVVGIVAAPLGWTGIDRIRRR